MFEEGWGCIRGENEGRTTMVSLNPQFDLSSSLAHGMLKLRSFTFRFRSKISSLIPRVSIHASSVTSNRNLPADPLLIPVPPVLIIGETQGGSSRKSKTELTEKESLAINQCPYTRAGQGVNEGEQRSRLDTVSGSNSKSSSTKENTSGLRLEHSPFSSPSAAKRQDAVTRSNVPGNMLHLSVRPFWREVSHLASHPRARII